MICMMNSCTAEISVALLLYFGTVLTDNLTAKLNSLNYDIVYTVNQLKD